MTLPEILQRRATDDTAFIFLNEHGAEEATLTYGELHARALGVAEKLLQLCKPGDRALLLFPPGLDFIVAYFGCLYAQVIAVPVNPPRKNRPQDATYGIIRDCEPAVVLTVSAMPAAEWEPHLRWLPVDKVAATTDFEPEPCPPDSLAFLQYTSGSTSAPKGVMVSHRNLVANQKMIQRAFGHDEHSTFVGWTPLYHDQGLIGNVLQPIYLGVPSVLMSPITFIRRPLLWLSAISRYRAHTSGGPNFAYDACVARAVNADLSDLDLSSWQVAFNGAEPIRHETLRRFADTFEPYGFRPSALYPCYGLAEATLLVTGSQKGRGPRTLTADAEALADKRLVTTSTGRSQTLVGSGLVLPEEDLRIVDPDTRRPCVADQIGEIWVSGDHVADGYWKRPELTADTFQAECEGRTYLRTGDLGQVIDGELYIVGRLKDMIIIRGRNYYPQDIEHAAQSAYPVHTTAAFAVPGADGEKLVVVQEIKPEHHGKTADIAASIREVVTREHQVSIGDLVLTVPGQLQKTSSGKIRRTAARTRYLQAAFERHQA